jgi:hypothetical protein
LTTSPPVSGGLFLEATFTTGKSSFFYKRVAQGSGTNEIYKYDFSQLKAFKKKRKLTKN